MCFVNVLSLLTYRSNDCQVLASLLYGFLAFTIFGVTIRSHYIFSYQFCPTSPQCRDMIKLLTYYGHANNYNRHIIIYLIKLHQTIIFTCECLQLL